MTLNDIRCTCGACNYAIEWRPNGNLATCKNCGIRRPFKKGEIDFTYTEDKQKISLLDLFVAEMYG